MRTRFEFIEGTLHWAHTEVAIELELSTTPPGPVEVRVTVLDYGNYWANQPEPLSATLRLRGVLREADDGVVVELEPPSPVQRLAWDPRVPLVEFLWGPGFAPESVPAFAAPLCAWARTQGLNARLP